MAKRPQQGGFNQGFQSSYQDAAHAAMVQTLRDMADEPERKLRMEATGQSIAASKAGLGRAATDQAIQDEGVAYARGRRPAAEARETLEQQNIQSQIDNRKAAEERKLKRNAQLGKQLSGLTQAELLKHKRFLLENTQGLEGAKIQAVNPDRYDDLLDQISLVDSMIGNLGDAKPKAGAAADAKVAKGGKPGVGMINVQAPGGQTKPYKDTPENRKAIKELGYIILE